MIAETAAVLSLRPGSPGFRALVFAVLALLASMVALAAFQGCAGGLPPAQVCGRVELRASRFDRMDLSDPSVAFALCIDGRPIGVVQPMPAGGRFTPLDLEDLEDLARAPALEAAADR